MVIGLIVDGKEEDYMCLVYKLTPTCFGVLLDNKSRTWFTLTEITLVITVIGHLCTESVLG